MKKIIGAMLVVMLLFSGCQTKEPATIRLGSMPTYSAAIYAVGIEEGFFEDAGVKVDLTIFRSARDRDAGATAGELDGFMTDIMGAVNLVDKGFDFKITSREFEDFGVVALGEGNKVGLAENTITEYVADAYIDGTFSKVNVLAVPDRMATLVSGELDMGVFPQPFMGMLLGQGANLVVSTAKEDFHPVVLVFAKDFIENDSKAIKAFYEGYQETIDFMNQEPYERYKNALVVHGLATQENVDLFRLPLTSYGLNQVSQEDYDAINLWMVDKGMIEASQPFKEVVDSSFVK